MNLQSNFGGLMDSARRVWITSTSMVKNRAELAMIELQEEKSRLISAAIWGGVFAFSSFMAVIAIAFTLLFKFWDQRLYVAGALLAFCLMGAFVAFLFLKKRIKSSVPFTETIAQLKKDRAWLQRRN